ncbi:carbohydrate esterase family 4 protein [Hydnum rufescens UP504]|uniref:chitin deacetylase n=1 Tax=Hydnum rufescens UP504 TaxID=1448309 RepID=A0A9P6DUC3_9AGAM|nr:carbohydrate esterase family 4 protein [Hydnum rufescens UP504]
MMLLSFLALSALSLGDAASIPPIAQGPRGGWYHEPGHPVTRLFQRGTPNPPHGLQTILDAFSGPFPPPNIPQSWIAALNASMAAGKIPNIPVTTMAGNGLPAYPNKLNPSDPSVCSTTYGCYAPGDLWNAPNGTVGLSFDDGPLPTSPPLYTFLKSNNLHATHFFIGVNILHNPNVFLQAFQDNQDHIAVHTYTHPYMTTKSNLDVLAELGYTSQIIADSTGGLVPKYWRPPYGDADNRVRAIAKEVFGLTTVIWNQDSADWELSGSGISLATVEASLKSWWSGPKSPGLIVLEHELSTGSVQAFIDTYPVLKANGWNIGTIPDVSLDPSKAWYQNAFNDTSPATSQTIIPGTGSPVPPGATPPGPSSTSLTSSISTSTSSSTPKNKSSASRLVQSSAYILVTIAGALVIML